MPCHPHPITQPSAAMLGTTSALLSQDAGQGAVVRRKAASGIAADNNLLTGPVLSHAPGGRRGLHSGAGYRLSGVPSGVGRLLYLTGLCRPLRGLQLLKRRSSAEGSSTCTGRSITYGGYKVF